MVGVEATGSGTVTPGDETTAAGCAKEPELILNNIPAKRQWRFFGLSLSNSFLYD